MDIIVVIKICVQYFCLDKNQVSETLYSKFVRCQSAYQLQNRKILLTLWGYKNPCGQSFLNLNFLPEKTYKLINTGVNREIKSQH